MNTKAAIGIRTVAFLLFQGVCFASISLDTECFEDDGAPNADRSLMQLSLAKVHPEKVVHPKQVGDLGSWYDNYSVPNIECEEDVGSRKKGLLAKRINHKTPTSSVSASAKKCGRLCVDNNATIMYAIERLDGLGETVGNLILFLAIAFSNSVGFGGLVHHHLRTNESDFKTMSTLMGLEYLDLVTTTPPKFRTCLHGLAEYGNHLGSLSKIRGTLLLDVYAHTHEFVSLLPLR